MRTTVAVFIFVLVAQALSAQDRVIKGQEPAFPPVSGEGQFILHPSRRSQSKSLKELVDASQIIVDATVQQVLPARVFPRRLETDVVLSTNRVIKGPEALTAFVVSQNGGVVGGFTEEPRQYSMMQTGEHYLIFGKGEDRQLFRPLAAYHVTKSQASGSAVSVLIMSAACILRKRRLRYFRQYEGILASELIRQITVLLPK